MGIFATEEIENIFILFDLKRKGSITKEKCREALKCLASSQFQFETVHELEEIPDKVDLATFKKLR